MLLMAWLNALTTDEWWLFPKSFAANIILGIHLNQVWKAKQWMMEIMDKGLTGPGGFYMYLFPFKFLFIYIST